VARIDGVLIRHAKGARAARLRCQAQREVVTRTFGHGRWTAVGWGRTRPDCTFTAAGRVGGSAQVRLEAIVAGVGRSNIVTIRHSQRR